MMLHMRDTFLLKYWHQPDLKQSKPPTLSFTASVQYCYKLLNDHAPSMYWPFISLFFLAIASNMSIYFIIITSHQTHILLNSAMREYQYDQILFYIQKIILLYILYDIIDYTCDTIANYLSIQWAALLENHFIEKITAQLKHIDNVHNILRIISKTITSLITISSNIITSSLRLSVQIVALYLYQNHLLLPYTYLFMTQLLLNYALSLLPTSWKYYFNMTPRLITQAIDHKEVITSSHGEDHLSSLTKNNTNNRKDEYTHNLMSSNFTSLAQQIIRTLSHYYIYYSQLAAYLSASITLDQHTSNVHSITKTLPHINILWSSIQQSKILHTNLSEMYREEQHIINIEKHALSSKEFISNPSDASLVHIHNITVHTGNKDFTINNFIARPGNKFRITGSNGTGKSTISHLLTQHILKDATSLNRYYSAHAHSLLAISPDIKIFYRPSRSDIPPYINNNAELLHFPIPPDQITDDDKVYLFDYLNTMLSLNLNPSRQDKTTYINEQIKNDFKTVLGLEECRGSSGQKQLMLGASFYLQIKRNHGQKLIIIDESCSNMDRSTDESTTAGKKERFINLIQNAASNMDAIIAVDHETGQNTWTGWTETPITSIVTAKESPAAILPATSPLALN